MSAKTLPAADRRILDAVKATKTAWEECRVTQLEASRLYHEAKAHPDMPDTSGPRRVSRKTRQACEKIYRQLGYDIASKANNQCHKVFARALRRTFYLKPATLAGAIAKLKFLASVDPEVLDDYLRTMSPARQILGDLGRLAGKAVRG